MTHSSTLHGLAAPIRRENIRAALRLAGYLALLAMVFAAAFAVGHLDAGHRTAPTPSTTHGSRPTGGMDMSGMDMTGGSR